MKHVAVIMGGYSNEVAISMQSGETVLRELDRQKYKAYPVHILKEKWVCMVGDQEYPIQKGTFSVELPDGNLFFDVVYNTIHGTPGEDGIMQAYLSLIGIPQTSSDFYQSALTFNKRDTLSILRPYGIPMATSVYVNQGDDVDTAFAKAVAQKVGFPCFVKPNRSGSSFGVSKIYEEAALSVALDKAFEEDNEALIESYLSGTEVGVGVCMMGGEVTVLPVCEIVSDNDFFDYEAKYMGKSQEIVPARLSEADTEKVQSLAKSVYELLKLRGICRVDFIFHQGIPHFVEINTNPGLSRESIIPREAKHAGISLSSLFGAAIEQALH